VLKILHNIYLINNSGILLFQREYGKIEFDDEVISYLTSLKTFFTIFFKESEELEIIILQNLKILFVSKNNILCIGLVDKDDDVNRTRKVLIEIIDEFVKKLKPIKIAFSGNIGIIKDFEQQVDKISQHGTITGDIRRDLSDVYFSVYTPTSLSPGTTFILYVWAYILEQKTDMSKMARMEEEYKEKGLKGPITAKMGEVFNIVLTLPPPLEALKKIETITWMGKITNGTFPVSVPKNTPSGSHLGRVQIFIDGFIKIDIEFILEIGASKTEIRDVTQKTHKINKFFASYSSEDRIEVMKRVQAVEASRPEVKVFVDCLSMQPGEEWESRIYDEISKSDVLLLFWTLQAKQSKWVTKEWTYALNNHGLHFIQPFPLEDPKNAVPPKELSALHFHDKYIIIIKGLENKI